MKKWFRFLKGMLAVSLVFLLSTQVFADELEDAQEEKEQAESNKESAESILAGLQGEKDSIQADVVKLDIQLADIQIQIDDLNAQKADLEAQIAVKQEELQVAKEQEQKQYADMCARIQYMYVNEGTNYADVLFAAESMSDILNQPEYASALADYDYNMLEKLVSTREQIANDEQLLQMNLNSVEQLTAQVEEKKESINALIDEKSSKLAEYEDLIEQQEKLIAQYDAEVQAAANRIAEIEAQASQNADFVPYSGGALVWPCPSSTRITSYYGYRTPDGGYVNANHKGIDIGAPTGTPAVAAASGVVVIARYSASAGNWVVISHGNDFYTIYMHASKLCVSEGDYVNAGDKILEVGSTGWSTGPHLHFGVGVGGYTSAYNVDPMDYFK